MARDTLRSIHLEAAPCRLEPMLRTRDDARTADLMREYGMEDTELLFRKGPHRPHGEASPARSSITVRSSDAARSSKNENGRGSQTASLASTEDSILLALIGQGDESAMAAIFDRYSRLIYSVALRVLRDPAATEDVLQDVLMQVWRKPDALAVNRETLGGWLAVAARNRSIDTLRRRKPSDAVDEVALSAHGSLADEAERNLMMERARLLSGNLPAEQRKALELAFFDGLSPAEIAETTGDPLGTVKSRIRSGLLMLRKAMNA